MKYRIERDSMGELNVPESASFGAQTQRALDNFGVSSRPMPAAFIQCLAHIKSAAAHANGQCGTLAADTAKSIETVAAQVAQGEFADQFPVSVFQTGSGTSTNMNMNEVLAHLASKHLGRAVHPNDDVNCSQSSNDVIPTCIQVATLCAIQKLLVPALQTLIVSVEQRSAALADVVKTGRTHLMDAMPITLGQELSAWSHQLLDAQNRLQQLLPRLRSLPIGGSAVGTGVNVPNDFPQHFANQLCELLDIEVSVCPNPYSRMAGQDVALECSAALRGLAIALAKIANDLRWMASGPYSGLAEITLKALQPGSSIMPGKVNPVLPEAVLMICADVMGNDASIAIAAGSGNFQLNTMLPLIAEKLDNSLITLRWACAATTETVQGFTVNKSNLDAPLASNPILVTALNKRIGYEAAAKIAKQCYEQQRPVLEVAAEVTEIPREELEILLNPLKLTQCRP